MSPSSPRVQHCIFPSVFLEDCLEKGFWGSLSSPDMPPLRGHLLCTLACGSSAQSHSQTCLCLLTELHKHVSLDPCLPPGPCLEALVPVRLFLGRSGLRPQAWTVTSHSPIAGKAP